MTDHLSLRERTSLVGAEDRHATKRFDGSKILDENMTLRHALRDDGE